MGDKQRWPREEALAVAEELVAKLQPFCNRIMICGSIRRKKATVGDVEIVYVPLGRVVEPDPATFDFFARPKPIWVDEAAEEIDRMLRYDVLEKRLSIEAKEAWGAKNKLARHVASGIPVDLFAATEESWWNYVVCRTGGAASNTRIAFLAKSMGWKWRPYGAGFTRRSGGDAGKLHPVTCERDVFDFVRIPYLEPEDRP